MDEDLTGAAIEDRIELIGSRFPMPEAYSRCVGFMFAVIERFPPGLLPPTAGRSLLTAADWWRSGGTPEALISMRVSVWNQLDELSRTRSVEPRSYSATRAALFVMFESPRDEQTVDIVGGFIDFALRGGLDRQVVTELLDEHFDLLPA